MKYAVGDRVRVRADIQENRAYADEGKGNVLCVHPMNKYAGQVFMVIEIYQDWYILDLLDGRRWIWAYTMLEGLDDEPVGFNIPQSDFMKILYQP